MRSRQAKSFSSVPSESHVASATPRDDPRGRRGSDHECGPPAHVAVAILLPRTHGDHRDDRGERGGFRREMREADHERKSRDEENPSADAEHPRKNAGGETEHEGIDDGHPMKSLTATATSSALRSRVRTRVGSRCWAHVPIRTPSTAGKPTSAASGPS
jgi:hypothetical protein